LGLCPAPCEFWGSAPSLQKHAGALPPAPPPRNLFEKSFLGTFKNFGRPETPFRAEIGFGNQEKAFLPLMGKKSLFAFCEMLLPKTQFSADKSS
jgi:hypothetical protein